MVQKAKISLCSLTYWHSDICDKVATLSKVYLTTLERTDGLHPIIEKLL